MAEEIDQDEQNNIELRYCLDTLSDKISKTNDKRVKEKLMKSYNILVSNKSPWIQKRQIMSQSCGDYRKKMADELKNHQKKAMSQKLEAISTDKLQESKFLKKKSLKNDSKSNSSSSDFKFDFGD